MVVEKAKQFGKKLGIIDEQITFSNGWLQKFKNRHQIKKYKLHGEAASVDERAIKNSID